jgi:methyltransferase (TIGR00027 family)
MVESAAKSVRLAMTGWWSAAAWAYETKRDDRLFEDPWASPLLGQQAKVLLPQSGLTRDTRAADELYAVITRYFDDYLLRVTREFGVRQVVLVASGLDTRGYRLAWPTGTNLFELERAHVLTYKDTQLGCAGVPASCNRHAVGVDLTERWDDSLRAVGFDPALPSAWLLEGFIYFLPEPAVNDVLRRISAFAASKSWIGMDVVNRAMLASPQTRHWTEGMSAAEAPWLFADDDPGAVLQRFGWRAETTEPGVGAADYGRTPYDPAARPDGEAPRSILVTATRTTS